MGPVEIRFLGVLLLAVLAGRLLRPRSWAGGLGPKLVLKQFDTDPPDGNTLLNLTGRPEGIIGWLLSSIGLEVTTTLSITQDFVYKNQSSLSGRFRQTVPADQVASTHCGYSMNVLLLVLAPLALLVSLLAAASSETMWLFAIGILVALLLVVAFFLSKCLVIAFETTGGTVLGVRLKRGLIENVPVGIEELSEVIARFNRQLERTPSTVAGTATSNPAATSAKDVEQWYYAKDGKKVGPLSKNQLKEMVRNGELSANDYLWKRGMGQWEPVNKFKWQ
jgi:hypothetical protein